VDEGSFIGVAGFCLGRPSTNSAAILTLGDAWGMIPPFTGNGMSMAFESAAIALEPLRSWQGGRETWQQALSRIQNRLAERFARRMFWARMMHPFLTTTAGQVFFTLVTRSRLLPFKVCVHAVR
jgi:menaquinone-9 beta-reductase